MSRNHKNRPRKPTTPPMIFVHILSPQDYLDVLSLGPLNMKAKYGQCFLACTDGISRPFEGYHLGTNTFLISASEYAGDHRKGKSEENKKTRSRNGAGFINYVYIGSFQA